MKYPTEPYNTQQNPKRPALPYPPPQFPYEPPLLGTAASAAHAFLHVLQGEQDLHGPECPLPLTQLFPLAKERCEHLIHNTFCEVVDPMDTPPCMAWKQVRALRW